jgi:HK97 family phage major capsid protein
MRQLALIAAMSSAAIAIPMTATERAAGRYMRDGTGHNAAGDGRRELSPEEIAQELRKSFDERTGKVQEIAEKALAEATKGIPMATTAKELADEAILGMNEAKTRLDELEQKMVRQREVETAFKSLGERVTDDENVKAFLTQTGKGRVGVEIEQKAIISALGTNAAGSAGAAIVPQRIPGVQGLANRPLRVRDLLMPGQTTSNSIQFVQETAFTNAAASVSETSGATKAQSDLQLNLVTSNVTTLAHWVQATRQILSDLPQLQSYIDGRLLYGLRYVEDNQLLNGAGTGTDLNGIYTQATASTANLAIIASPTKIDVLRAAILQATLANLPASGIVLHPTDWFTIETAKDSQTRYLVGDPQNRIMPRLWGLPVVETLAMTVGKFLTGAFDMGAQIFDRQDASVEISTEDGTNFVKNLVTILCEERLALAVYNTLAFVKGDFAAQITDLTS